MTRIVVDALAARHGGTAYAAVRVAQELARGGLFDEVLVVTRSESAVHCGVHGEPGVRAVCLGDVRAAELPRRTAWQALRLPELVREGRDVLLSWSGMLPRRPPAPLVSYLCNPVMFRDGRASNALRRAAVRRTSRHAAAVLVPSHAMADLVEPTVRRRPTVVPHGVDHGHFTPAEVPGDEVLCVANLYAHKRHDVVLAAWAALPSPRPTLRLVGDPGVDPKNAARVAHEVDRRRHLGEVILEHEPRLGGLPAAYRRARVLVIASEHESFCLPVLEALSCGVPVVARDTPVLRETAGSGGHYVSGAEPAAWTKAILDLLVDDQLHARLRAEGLAGTANYSWARSAAGVADALRAAEAHMEEPCES